MRMRIVWAGAAMVASVVVSPPRLAQAVVVPGGGSPTVDCVTVFDIAVDAAAVDNRNVVCTDGDPLCDDDAAEGPNGVCVIPIAVCLNSTQEPSCTLSNVESVVVDHALDNGDTKFDPQFQALQARIDSELIDPPITQSNVCSLATNFVVPIRGPIGNNRCSKGKKKIQLTGETDIIDGKVYSDRDKLKLICLPAPTGGCDPHTLFDGTFDRIQRQVFNQDCALSGCHDSQTEQNDLLLESGASLSNLVNVDPFNGSAVGLGWKRVTVLTPDVSGNPDTSYLYHKVTGDLLNNPGLGAQMPLNRRKLNKTLREIIRLWIEGGAPATGWVPGTD